MRRLGRGIAILMVLPQVWMALGIVVLAVAETMGINVKRLLDPMLLFLGVITFVSGFVVGRLRR